MTLCALAVAVFIYPTYDWYLQAEALKKYAGGTQNHEKGGMDVINT